MRKILIIGLLLSFMQLHAQTTGAPLNLGTPDPHSAGWNFVWNNNADTINNTFNTLLPSTNGIVYRTGILSTRIATFADVVAVWGGGSCVGFLKNDGTCSTSTGAVISVFGRGGAVVAAANDYSFSLIGGNLGVAQGPTALTGILKDTAGTLSVATAGTDYLTPTGSAAGLSRASNTAFGVAECDNTTITCANGVFTSIAGGIPSGTTNQLLFYAATGNTVTPLTLGTNLSITGTTLNASSSASTDFSALSSGTNNTATMNCGAGCTVTPVSTGIVNANQINGVSLATLATGILKNTTTTGVPSIAVAGTDYLTPTGSGAGLTALNASQLTTGTVPVARLPLGTTSTAGALQPDGTTITVVGGVISAVGGGSGVLSLSVSPSQYGSVNSSTGAVSLSLNTQRGRNAVTDLGMDNTGGSDIGAAMNSYCSTYGTSNTMPELFFPAGTYLVTTPIACAGSSTTLNNFTMIGESRNGFAGTGAVKFSCNTSGATCFWLDNVTTTAANQRGPRIEHINFDDAASGHDYALLRITQYNNLLLTDVGVSNSTGQQYLTGTVSITNGSTSVTGAGTTWFSGMNFGLLCIAGNCQEINAVSGTGAITLTSAWQYPTASGAAYVIDYQGVGLMLEGTTATGFTQYGEVYGLSAYNNRLAVDAVGGPASTSGTSRIHFYGGFINCNRLPDSQAFFFGKFSDTMNWDTDENNCSTGGTIESGHAHKISGHFENTGTFAVVTTCNSGVASQACTKGVVLNADAVSTGHDNAVNGGYIYNVGNAIQIDSANVTTGYILGNDLRSNTNNYQFADASTGCSATNTAMTIVQSDCTTFQTSPSITVPLNKVVTPTANATLDVNAFTETFRAGQSGPTTATPFTFRDAATNTGNQVLVNIQTFSGIGGMQPINIQGAVSQWFMSRTGNITFQATTAATSGTNVNSLASSQCGNDFTTLSESNCYTWQVIPNATATVNIASSLVLTHTGGGTGATTLDLTHMTAIALPGLTQNFLPKAGAASVVNSLCDEGVTTANTFTCSDTAGMAAAAYSTNGTTNGADNYTFTGSAAAAPGTNTFQISPAIAITTPWSLSPAAAPATGFLFGTNTSGIEQQSFVGSTGTGNVVLAASPTINNLTVTGTCTGCGGSSSGSTNQVARFSATNTVSGSTSLIDDLSNLTYLGQSASLPGLYSTNVGPTTNTTVNGTSGVGVTTLTVVSTTGYMTPTANNPIWLRVFINFFTAPVVMSCTTSTTTTFGNCTRGLLGTTDASVTTGATAWEIQTIEFGATTSTIPNSVTFWKGEKVFFPGSNGMNDTAGNGITSKDTPVTFGQVAGTFNGPNGSAEVVASSATPTFSVGFTTSRIVLTANITTFTLGVGIDGQVKNLCFKQGATPFTVTAPANVHGFFTVGVTANGWNCQPFTYDAPDVIWLATGTGITNQ